MATTRVSAGISRGRVHPAIDLAGRLGSPVLATSNAQTVTQAVATPIEQELNGTPGMLYMESSSTNSGGFTATITFDIDTDAPQDKIDSLLKLTERYCVVFQTINRKPDLTVTVNRG